MTENAHPNADEPFPDEEGWIKKEPPPGGTVDSAPEDMLDLLPEARAGHGNVAEALEASLHNPVKPAFFTPAEERFPPLTAALLPEDSPSVTPAPDNAPRHRRFRGDWRHDLIALFYLLLTIALCGYYVAFWVNPYAPWNPLAKPTPYVQVTWTPDLREMVNLTPSITNPMPTGGGTPAVAGETPITALSTPVAAVPTTGTTQRFTLTEAGIIYAPNANGRGCDWASIAGTVTGRQSEPLNGYSIHIMDALEPERLDVQVYSGASLTFGAGGFELFLGGTPRRGQYVLQLLDPMGIAVSDEFMILTRDTCAENVVIVNFIPAE